MKNFNKKRYYILIIINLRVELLKASRLLAIYKSIYNFNYNVIIFTTAILQCLLYRKIDKIDKIDC